MKNTHFNYRFQVAKTTNEVFDKLCMVSKWWTIDTEGIVEKLHDEFTVHFGESFVTMKVTEMIPGQKMTWAVKNCFWAFFKNKTEWNGTTITWDISTSRSLTQLSITHFGLVPDAECFEICKEGWGLYAGNSLFRLITENSGIPFQGNGKNARGCKH
jgi:hypothetical protein